MKFRRITTSLMIFSTVLVLFYTGTVFAQTQFHDHQVSLKEIMASPPIEGNRPEAGKFSPDGKFVTYLWRDVDNDNISNIWLFSIEKEKREKIVENHHGSYFWSMNSQKILYVQDGDLVEKDIRSKKVNKLSESQKIPVNFFPSNRADKIVYVNNGGLWLYDIRTKKNNYITGHKRSYLITWSPDDSHIGYCYDMNLYTVNVENNYQRKVTDFEPEDKYTVYVAPEGVYAYKWSPDSKYIMSVVLDFTVPFRNSIVPDYLGKMVKANPSRNDIAGDPFPIMDVAVTELGTGKTTHINHGGENALNCFLIDVIWSNDSKMLLLNRIEQDYKKRSLVLAEPDSPEVSVLFEEEDEAWVTPENQTIEFSPDDRSVYFTSQKSGNNHLYKIDIGSRELKQLTDGDFELNVQYNTWSVQKIFQLHPDGKGILFISNEAHLSEAHIYYLDLFTGEKYKLNTLEGYSENLTFSPDGKMVLYDQSGEYRPYDYNVLKIDPDAEPLEVSTTISEKFRSVDWNEPEYITFKNIEDNVDVHAKLFLPPEMDRSKKYPLLIFLHGGGTIQNVVKKWTNYHRELMFHHLMANRGYVVMEVDFRGTTGYGRDFGRSVYQKMGIGKDLSDLVSGIKYLESLGYIDPDRVGVYGGSGGGFLTLMSLCLKPEYFTCGASLRCLTDWSNYNSIFTTMLMGRPQDNPEAFRECSPINHAEKLTRPLLLMHGMKDSNSYAQESIKFAEKLIQAGIDFEFMLYPSEDHGFVDPECWYDEYRRIARFMDKYLLKN